ncbi:MAG: hypothetical protein AAF628_13160 [Planctomycetota bacterium]
MAESYGPWTRPRPGRCCPYRDRRQALLCALRDGQSLKDAAAAAGIPRSSLYLERSRDPEFARELADARRSAEPAPVPRSNDRPGLTRVDATLDRELIVEFMKALRRTGRIPSACREVGIDMYPDRVAPKDIPGEAREKLREAVGIIQAARREPPKNPEQRALLRWLAGEPWPDEPLDKDELMRLSPRAAIDHERALLLRVAERAANECPGTPSLPQLVDT